MVASNAYREGDWLCSAMDVRLYSELLADVYRTSLQISMVLTNHHSVFPLVVHSDTKIISDIYLHGVFGFSIVANRMGWVDIWVL